MLDRKTAPTIYSLGKMELPASRKLLLPNGMKMIVTDGGKDEVNRLTVIMDSGLAEASDPAVARICALTLNEGSLGMSSREMAEVLEFNGSWLVNAPSPHHLRATMYSLNRNMDKVLPVFTEMLAIPAFPAHEVAVASEKAARQLEIEREKTTWHANQAARRLAMGATHPLSLETTPDALRDVSVDSLRDFYSRALVPSRATVYLGGHISPALEDAVANALGSIPAQGASKDNPLVIKPFNPILSTRVNIPHPGAVQNSVTFTLPAPPQDSPDSIPLQLAVLALGGYFGSRLNASIREEKGLTYGIHASLQRYLDGDYILVSAETDPSYVGRLIDETCNVVESMSKAPLTADEMECMRKSRLTTLASWLDSPLSVTDLLVNYHLTGSSPDSFLRGQEVLAELTASDISEISARYLDPGRMSIAVAGIIDEP